MAPRTAATQRPGKLRLSPTRLRLYLFCPKAYHYYYIRRLRWGEMTAANSFGGSLHRALQEFHATGMLTPPSVDDLIESFRTRWTPAGYQDTGEAAEHLSAGQEILRQYFHVQAPPAPQPGLVDRR